MNKCDCCLINDIALSFDIDWAPDFIIDYTAELLIKKNIKATWFITHNSEAIERLSEHRDIFDLGIHPNFLENSTQGNTIKSVMDYVMEIVPNAVSVRTHGMYYSAQISEIFSSEYGLKYDSSIYLKNMPFIQPQNIYYGDNLLIRMPYFWEESGEMMNPEPSFDIDNKYKECGLKIFDLHPIHIFLNSNTIESYNQIKSNIDIELCVKDDVMKFVNHDKGTRSFLLDLISEFGTVINNISCIGNEWIKQIG